MKPTKQLHKDLLTKAYLEEKDEVHAALSLLTDAVNRDSEDIERLEWLDYAAVGIQIAGKPYRSLHVDSTDIRAAIDAARKEQP